MLKKYFKKNKKNGGFTRLVDFGDAISSRTKSASSKLTTGFTIIETMIALSVFLIVIVIGVGALINAYLINKKSQDMRSIMDGLSFSMDDMSKSIRTGYDYHCLDGQGGSDISIAYSCLGGYGIAFKHIDPNNNNVYQWVYSIQSGKLYRSTDGGNSAVQMTPNEIVLDGSTYNFSVIGAENTDTEQPLVIIRLVGKITSSRVETPFSLQTAVSQRLVDN